jgi:hypothetical protein
MTTGTVAGGKVTEKLTDVDGPAYAGVRRFIPNGGNLARPKRFELLTPRFVVWGRALKSLRFVPIRIV